DLVHPPREARRHPRRAGARRGGHRRRGPPPPGPLASPDTGAGRAVSVIEVKRLRKLYGRTAAVDGVSFRVERGEIFGILGPNGAGKTTTVECVQGLRPIDGGRVKVLGLDPQRSQREVRRRIGSQLQESALPDRLKVWEALDLFASITRHGPDWHTLLDTWGLADQ